MVYAVTSTSSMMCNCTTKDPSSIQELSLPGSQLSALSGLSKDIYASTEYSSIPVVQYYSSWPNSCSGKSGILYLHTTLILGPSLLRTLALSGDGELVEAVQSALFGFSVPLPLGTAVCLYTASKDGFHRCFNFDQILVSTCIISPVFHVDRLQLA